ncbi:MAG: hypothetical protein MJY91_03575 [Bacteroidales bacterium]|nr:hypothetical protein [Candidatus Cryptobacteroides choladohippi]MCQ2179169.1 hypothetical protein [Bacteroidales bacterium]
MKRITAILCLCILILSGCSKTYKDIKVTSFEVISITPKGLNQVDALVDVGIYNPIVGFEVTDVLGVLKMDGEPCVNISTDQLTISGKTEKVYRIPLHGELEPGFNPLSLLKVAQTLDFSGFTADVNGKVSLRGGIGKTIALKGLKLGELEKRN